MDQAVLAQKIKRAVDGDRRWTAFRAETVHDFISAQRLMARQQSFEHLAAHLGQPLTARRTQPFGVGKRRARAAAVIVIGRWKYGLCL